MSELASLADNDPAVLIAAIVYESEHALDYSVLSRSCVVHRLHVCLRSLIRQPVDAT